MNKNYSLNHLYIYHKICNQRCRHCWVVPFSKGGDFECIDISYIKRAIEECVELGLQSVKITGGEPLLIPYIEELILFLKEKNLKIWIETNGTLINERIAQILKKADTFLSISLDSINPEIHDKFRNMKDAFNKTIKGIEIIRNFKLNFQIITSLSIFNKEEVEEIIEFAFLKGAKNVKINIIIPIGRAKYMEKRKELLTLEEILEIYERIYEKFIKNKNLEVIYDIPPAFLHGKSLLIKGRCGILNLLSIFTDGTVSICGIGNIVEKLKFGNIKKDSIKEIWQENEILKKLRESLPDKLRGICSKCIFKKDCLGKCVSYTYFLTGDFLSSYPFCEIAFKEKIFPENKLIGGFENG